jgi:hypothetical protein
VTGRVVRWLANLALIAVILGIGVWNYTQVNQAEKALCSLRDNLEVRVASSQQYTLDALSNLNCKRIGDA